jgi:mannose/cellobiose epimerase-like protein (N-acyl-D-glucosamine 2-epimerase family)
MANGKLASRRACAGGLYFRDKHGGSLKICTRESAMKRRDVLKTALAASVPAMVSLPAVAVPSAEPSSPGGVERLPERIAGMTLAQLAEDYRHRLFDLYLPFWDRGGYDKQHGGFMCELNDDGSVANDVKYIWYQGRGIWVYSFLYQHFGRQPQWLEAARKSRDFMCRHMHAGEGKWYEKVGRDGKLLKADSPNVYGWLFAAMGLAEYYHISHVAEDLDLVKQSLRAAIKAYDDPGYTDVDTASEVRVPLPKLGVRLQGHSMVLVTVLSSLLSVHEDPQLDALRREHIRFIIDKFWHPEYGITNEFLQHDYGRDPACNAHMYAGHSVETLWLIMWEALRTRDRTLFATAKNRARRILEMCWDYVFGGFCDEDYFVFGTPQFPRGPTCEVKTMWAQCEALITCMMALETTGEAWAREWYERFRTFALKTMPVPAHGVWRQAVNRFGKDIKRVGITTKRKDNYHQVRYLMLNLLSLERMLAGKRRLLDQERK